MSKLSSTEAQIFTMVRTVLADLQERSRETFEDGMVVQACETAEDAVFQVLNLLKHRCGDKEAAAAIERGRATAEVA